MAQNCGVVSRSTDSCETPMVSSFEKVSFVFATRAFGAAAAVVAYSIAVPSSSSSDTHFHASPASAACWPDRRSPKMTMALAVCSSVLFRSLHVWPPPEWIAIWWKRESNLADSPARIMSHASARFMPAPTAAPFTAAIVGSVEWATARKPV